MQVAFHLAGEITQVLDAIPWVRCASGNVLGSTWFWQPYSACLIGTTNVLKLPACECLYFADLYCCWSVINFLHASRGCVPHIRPMECIKKYCPLGSISQYTPKGAGSVLDNMIFKYRVIQYHPCCK